jgi:hypothetical protein
MKVVAEWRILGEFLMRHKKIAKEMRVIMRPGLIFATRSVDVNPRFTYTLSQSSLKVFCCQ